MDNAVTTAIIGIAGIIIGASLTFLAQWFTAKRQHTWARDLNMRQRRYERLRDRTNIISRQVGLRTTLLMDLESYELQGSTLPEKRRREISKQIKENEGLVHSSIMATGSDELRTLYLTLNKYYESVLYSHDFDELSRGWEAARSVHNKMESLLDETLVKD